MLKTLIIVGLVVLVLLLVLLIIILYASSHGERIIESTDHNIVQ